MVLEGSNTKGNSISKWTWNLDINWIARHSLMARTQDSVSLFWRKNKWLPPVFEVKVFLFFVCFIFKKVWLGVTRDHQGSPKEVPLGSLGFLQLNIIDFTNPRPKMAAFSLKTFRLFLSTYLVLNYCVFKKMQNSKIYLHPHLHSALVGWMILL